MKRIVAVGLVAALLELFLVWPLNANDSETSSRSLKLLSKTTLALLQEGNARFVSGALKHPNTDAAHRSLAAAEGQEPFVTVLSCADSRVPVELIFDRGVGEIFTVRVAGNVADTDEIATVEYGVAHLNTPLVIVMGHTKCGAVTAVVKGAELDGLLPQLVDNIKPAAESARNEGGEEPAIIANAIKANVRQSMADMLRRSEVIRKQIQAGNTSVVGAIYNLETGTVEWLGEHPEQKQILNAYQADAKVAGHDDAPPRQPTPPILDPHQPPPPSARKEAGTVVTHGKAPAAEAHGH
ncbi:MAG: carbonic anhydrase [Verrucomicrobiota bacterium]